MKRQHVLSLFLFCILLAQISCICDCAENGEYFKLKLLKDGQNALFGPGASLNRDSIRFFDADPLFSVFDEYIEYRESTETMDLFIKDGRQYLLKIENIRTDTITGTLTVISTRKCGCCGCPYRLTNVKMNGQVICQEEACSHIIEIQL